VGVVSSVGSKVRETPAGSYIKTELYNTRGIVIEWPPQDAYLNSTLYTWWKVRYEDGVEGWSAEGYPGGESYLEKIYVMPSTKFSIGNRVKVNANGVYVRSDPPELAGLGSVNSGDQGTVIASSFYGVPKGSSGFYYFWKIDYDTRTDGWTAEIYLDKDSCTNECSSGQTRCNGNYKQSCGNYDADSCLEWPSSTSGSGNEYCSYTCSNGVCNSQTCNPNSKRCNGNIVETCKPDGSGWTTTQNCGSSSCGSFGNNYCKSNNVYHSRACNNMGCSANACFDNPYTDEQLVQTCPSGQTCSGNSCINQGIIPTLKWPLSGSIDDRKPFSYFKFGSDWTCPECSYCGGLPKKHTGLDIRANVGEAVYASNSGTVRLTYDLGNDWAEGIIIEHSGFTTSYLHISRLVNQGDYVLKGQKIATIADISASGSVSHLHYGVRNSLYSSMAQRGALPQVHDNSNTYCQNDDLFPENFVDPLTLNYESVQYINGIDVSHYQHNCKLCIDSGSGYVCPTDCQPIDWNKVFSAGYQFVYIQTSQGDTQYPKLKNPLIDEDVKNAQNGGLKAGAYHFSYPSINNAVNEAQHFIDVSNTYS